MLLSHAGFDFGGTCREVFRSSFCPFLSSRLLLRTRYRLWIIFCFCSPSRSHCFFLSDFCQCMSRPFFIDFSSTFGTQAPSFFWEVSGLVCKNDIEKKHERLPTREVHTKTRQGERRKGDQERHGREGSGGRNSSLYRMDERNGDDKLYQYTRYICTRYVTKKKTKL